MHWYMSAMMLFCETLDAWEILLYFYNEAKPLTIIIICKGNISFRENQEVNSIRLTAAKWLPQ